MRHGFGYCGRECSVYRTLGRGGGTEVRRPVLVCKMEMGGWITFENGDYFLGDLKIAFEDAMVVLRERHQRGPFQVPRQLPSEDRWIILNPLNEGSRFASTSQFENHLVKILKSKTPPWDDWYWLHFEQIHRFVLSLERTDRRLSNGMEFYDGPHWSDRFGEIIRSHKPAISPLTRWDVDIELAHPALIQQDRDRKRTTIWAFNEARIEHELRQFYGRRLLSATQLQGTEK